MAATIETIQTYKQSVSEILPKIKRDAERINELVRLLTESVDKITVENAQSYADKLELFNDSFEIIEFLG